MRSHIEVMMRGESPDQRQEEAESPKAALDRRNDINGSTSIPNLDE